jgi:hypothetical protein
MRTLKAGVGGYYESFKVLAGSFEASDNVLTVFARFKRTPAGVVLELRRLFFHLYDQENLIIGTLTGLPADISPSNPIKLNLTDFEIFDVPPIRTFRKVRWNSSRLAIRIKSAKVFRFTAYRGLGDQCLTRFYEGVNGRRLLKVTVAGGTSLRLEVDETAFESFLERTDQKIAF